MRISLTFPTISEEPSSNTMEFCCGNGMTMKKFVTVLWRQPCLIHVLQVDWKCLVDPMASCFIVNRIWPLFSTSELLYPNMKFRKRLIRAKTNFARLVKTTTLVLELLIVRSTLAALPLGMIATRNKCAGVWLDFNASCYWKLSLPRTNWRTTESGANFHLCSGTWYWTHRFVRMSVFACSWKVWCCWKENRKWTRLLSSKKNINHVPLSKYRYFASYSSLYAPFFFLKKRLSM